MINWTDCLNSFSESVTVIQVFVRGY